MPNSYIADKTTKINAAVSYGIETPGLVVATRPLKEFTTTVKPFLNDEYGINMNVEIVYGGSPINVHNGLDDVYWTGTSIVGSKFNFNSVDVSYTGTYSIKIDNAALNDVLQLINPSGYQDLTGYESLTMKIYVDRNWLVGDHIALYGYDTVNSLEVGDRVNLESYITYNDYRVWQSVTISLKDMNLVNRIIDSFRLEIIAKDGKSPKFYIDDMKIEETGAPITYTVKPVDNRWLYVENLKYTLVDQIDTSVLNSTSYGLSYDKLLGMPSLSNGITWKRWSDNDVKASFTIKNFGDIIELPHAHLSFMGCDGVNTILSVDYIFPQHIKLRPEYEEKMTITISDSLNDLIKLRAYCGCYEEDRSEYKTKYL